MKKKKIAFRALLVVVFLSLVSFKSIYRIEDKFRDNTDQEITGVYVLTSCENSRFKIKIEKKAGVYFFLVLDKNKVISKGKLKKEESDRVVYLTFGKMGGMYSVNKIQIQNYGNAMNEYEHFTQCDEKYLSFVKLEE
ncbi:hypothetical protein [Flavobacterium collinsii]|uniref:Uncharacterized protein n=1 Tax=Flavobacterium collinsii TaxID=1114861 RepID=A0A9W4TIA7_9FLAO|nr:hypothetical protein [Flavobacterium collinsii]CAI2768784.1 conserved protein of unknown function [Flavobacterium collinsii]